MKGWKTYRLSDLMRIIGGGTPKTNKPDYWGGDIPWLSVKDFGNGIKRVYETEKHITDKGLEESSTKLLKKGQLIISARGTVGEIAQLGRAMAFNQSCYGLDANEDMCTNDYLYYLLKFKIADIRRNTHGAVFDTITRSTFNSIEVALPSLFEQKFIAKTLSALDDKIELNNRINRNLEALAQAIFKYWFIDFEFPNEQGKPYRSSGGKMVDSELGEIPEGWEIRPISHLFESVIGGDWGTETMDEDHVNEVYVIRGTDIPMLSQGGRAGIPVRYVAQNKYEKRKLFVGDIVMEISGGSKDQPTGRTLAITEEILSRLNNRCIPASFCRLIRPKNIQASTYLRLYLTKLYDEGGTWTYQNQSTGISNFQFKYFENKEVICLPLDENILNAFHRKIEPLLQRANRNENIHLTAMRDALLPKLMSGELSVHYEMDQRKHR